MENTLPATEGSSLTFAQQLGYPADNDNDPIFPALVRFRRARFLFEGVCKYGSDEALMRNLGSAEADAWAAAATTIPTTIAGCMALIGEHRAFIAARQVDFVCGDCHVVLATVGTALRNIRKQMASTGA